MENVKMNLIIFTLHRFLIQWKIVHRVFVSVRRKFDSLIQAQARELSHLRQRLREGRGVCSILTQQLGDTTKAFEELLRANDVDYYMGQSFREQLAQSGALAQRVGAKISGRESRAAFLFMTSFIRSHGGLTDS